MIELERIHSYIDQIDLTLKELQGQSDPTNASNIDIVNRLMEGIFQLGIHLINHETANPQVTERLHAQAEALFTKLNFVDYYLILNERKLHGANAARWPAICYARSSLQFLIEVYSETRLPNDPNGYTEDELEDFDEIMRQVYTEVGGVKTEDIPIEIPESHWWWF